MNSLYYFIFWWLLLIVESLAQTYTCTVHNQTVNGTDFSFDIYMQRTDATEIYLGQSEFSLEFNNGNFTSPTVANVAGPELEWYTVDVAIPVGYPDVVKFSVGALFFNNQNEFDDRVCNPSTDFPGTLVATITISGISNYSGTAGLHWRLVTPHDSKVNNYSPSFPWPLTNITALGTYIDPIDIVLPVELKNFTVRALEDKVELSWDARTEVDNNGFEIERAAKENENLYWLKIGFVKRKIQENIPGNYYFVDKNLWGGNRFVYRIKQLDEDGTFRYSDEVEVELLPNKYELYQNYPNPFNPVTSIKFSLPEEAQITIKVFDVVGSMIDEIVNEEFKAGFHKVEFNASSYASGMYIYELRTDKFLSVKKMLLLK